MDYLEAIGNFMRGLAGPSRSVIDFIVENGLQFLEYGLYGIALVLILLSFRLVKLSTDPQHDRTFNNHLVIFYLTMTGVFLLIVAGIHVFLEINSPHSVDVQVHASNQEWRDAYGKIVLESIEKSLPISSKRQSTVFYQDDLVNIELSSVEKYISTLETNLRNLTKQLNEANNNDP